MKKSTSGGPHPFYLELGFESPIHDWQVLLIVSEGARLWTGLYSRRAVRKKKNIYLYENEKDKKNVKKDTEKKKKDMEKKKKDTEKKRKRTEKKKKIRKRKKKIWKRKKKIRTWKFLI